MIEKYKDKFVRVITADEKVEIGTLIDADKEWVVLKCVPYEKDYFYPHVETTLIDVSTIMSIDVIGNKGKKALKEKFDEYKESEKADDYKCSKESVEVG